jgi:hypothetical protein
MFNIRKNYNNEDNTYNQNNYQNQPSLGSISKKSTKRQMTRPYLNTKYSQIPRLNELLNDNIFQFYFRSRLKSKEYNKFRYYNEIEKLNFIIDLYFYVMNQANFNEEENILVENYENENNENDDGVDKLVDNVLILDNNQSRMNIIEKMKEYKLFDLNWENSYAERFNKILNKYRNGINNNDNEETINYYKTDKVRDTNIENNKNLTNINFKSKANVKTNNNEQTLNNNEESKIDNENEENYYKNILLMNRLPSIYDKIKISNIKFLKLGKLRIKKLNSNNNYNKEDKINERDFVEPEEFEIKSKKNNIQINELDKFRTSKSKIYSKLKYNISPLLINTDNNEIIIQEPMIISQSNKDFCKLNLLLKKQINENETDELIKKIYQYDENNTSFNKNEINKIGIIILNYIRLEKKYESIEASFFIYKDRVAKLKERMKMMSSKAFERIKESSSFIKQQNNKN